MNWDTVKGNWKEMQGELKKKWSKLTEDDIGEIDGSREKLVGALQKHYGKTKEEAEEAVNNWQD